MQAPEATPPPRSELRAEAAAPAPPIPRSAAELWSAVTQIALTNRRLRAVLDGTTIGEWTDATATLHVAAHSVVLVRGAIRDIEEAFTRAAGRPLTVSVLAPGGNGTPAEPSQAQPGGARAAAPAADVRQHPLVKQAEELFGGRVVRVEPRRQAGGE